MLKNKIFQFVIFILLIGVAFYNLWFFVLKPKKTPTNQPAPVYKDIIKPPPKNARSRNQAEQQNLTDVTGESKRDLTSLQYLRNPFLTPKEEELFLAGELLPASSGSSNIQRSAALRTKKKPKPTYKITTIIISEQDKSAVIDGEFYRQGDTIGDEQITFIDRYSIMLSDQKGETRTVELSYHK